MEREPILRAVAYVEEHLGDGIVLDNAALARAAGYSVFHFLRLFRRAVRMTPADYVRKRRITEIVKRMEDGAAMSDIAFAYGFNSRENFTRAFFREHRILPTEYRSSGCSLRLWPPFSFDRRALEPQVSVGYPVPFAVIAYPSDEAFPPRFWNRYNAERRSVRLTGGAVTEDYGVMIRAGPGAPLDYFIGVREEAALGDREGTVRIPLGGGLHAFFRTAPAGRDSFVDTIQNTWSWIYDVWLPGSGYRRRPGYEYEEYMESSRTFSERIAVPVERAEEEKGGDV